MDHDFIKTNHGGGCCGITHISNFDTPEDYCDTKKEFREFFKDGIRDLEAIVDRTHSYLYEVVLTDEQLHEGWLSVMHKVGFKRVTRFVNANSNNTCNVFHFVSGTRPAPKYKGRR